MPFRILSIPTSMRRFLVASCLGDVTQQIHSFRAKGLYLPRGAQRDISSMAFGNLRNLLTVLPELLRRHG